MRLLRFSVRGLRSLADVQSIPVRRPTVLTGSNDGGKTSALRALQVLLTGRPDIDDEDRTCVIASESDGFTLTGDGLHHATVEVIGVFQPTVYEQQELSLPDEIRMRRISTSGDTTRLEIERTMPLDTDLCNLDQLGLTELRGRAEGRGLTPDGPRTSKAAWLTPLAALAAAEITAGRSQTGWDSVNKALADRLPHFLPFSSTEEPDPEAEIKAALQASFKQLIEGASDRFVVVRELEKELQDELAQETDGLRQLIKQRCPRIGEITIVPHISFAEGLRGVEISRAKDDGRRIGLRRGGAGRRRQINLAVWEWASKQLKNPPPNHPGVVIAYDEPDTHLDYGHQRQLFDLILDQCAQENAQMIVVTHSLNFIDRVDPADVVHLQLDLDERTHAGRLLSDNHQHVDGHLAQMATAMGLRNSVLLHERCFLGVEGPTEMQCLPILFKLAMGLPLQAAGIALISGESNVGALNVAKYLHDAGRKVAFLVDRDSLSKSGSKTHFTEANLSRAGIGRDQRKYLGDNEIEDLFTDEQWCTAANRYWARVDGRTWTAEDFTAVRHDGKFSADLLSLVQSESEDAPKDKPGLLFGVTTILSRPEEVPAELVKTFKEIQEMAA
jgi:putative ATP-dependent endonuclease of the OLD family